MKTFEKNMNVKDIERNTKNTLYYIQKALEAIASGESAMIWLCQAVQYAGDLKVNYAKAEVLDIFQDLDFKKIYKLAASEAKKEAESDK